MLYLDQFKLPVDQTADGGDSAVRAGLLCTFKYNHNVDLFKYTQRGYCFRHPNQYPWSNKNNFSRDQLIPLSAGLWKQGFKYSLRDVFLEHLKRGFFCQNIERDVSGSTKYPWPHSFVNDKGEKETRLFDFADILLPDHILHLILCAKLYPLYIFGLIGYPWLVLSILIHSQSSHKEHNQIICQCKVAGKPFIKLFKYVTPNWKEDLREYWGSRNEMEYADLIIAGLE